MAEMGADVNSRYSFEFVKRRLRELSSFCNFWNLRRGNVGVKQQTRGQWTWVVVLQVAGCALALASYRSVRDSRKKKRRQQETTTRCERDCSQTTIITAGDEESISKASMFGKID